MKKFKQSNAFTQLKRKNRTKTALPNKPTDK